MRVSVCPCVRVSVCPCVCTNAYSSQTEGRTVSKFCLPPWNPRTGIWWYLARNSTTLRRGGNALRHASVCIRCEMVWSATFLRRTTTSESKKKEERRKKKEERRKKKEERRKKKEERRKKKGDTARKILGKKLELLRYLDMNERN